MLIQAPDRLGQDARRVPLGARPPRAREPGASAARALVYVSPLKALSYDIERNLRAPLRGIGADAARRDPHRRHAASASARAILREPPDILITTPESLYLMLTSRARAIARAASSAVIVDEIHAVAATKRGAHLALSLERLDALARGGRLQRIGLSATQRPLEEIGRFLVGPTARCQIVDAGIAQGARPADPRAGRVDARAGRWLRRRRRAPLEDPLEPSRAARRCAARSGRRSTRSCSRSSRRTARRSSSSTTGARRAARAAPERARRADAAPRARPRRRRSRAPTTARSRARSARSSRSC